MAPYSDSPAGDQATRSALARVIANYAMPILLGIIATLGGLVLGDIRTQIGDLGQQQQQARVDVQVLNAKLDNGVLWRITELERRVDSIERAAKVP